MPSVGMRYYQWWNEALHGVATSPGVLFDETAPSATSFPQIISTSHSFNRSLFSAIGAAIGTEIRAFANLQRAGLTYWTPNLNIFRDPRWGRGQETPGEDPYLNAQYVAEYVPALQYDRAVDAHHLKVSACCKHFAANTPAPLNRLFTMCCTREWTQNVVIGWIIILKVLLTLG